MNLDYTARLVCLSMAVFFAVHAVAGSAVCLLAGWAARAASFMRARSAARLLLVLRWTPALMSFSVVAALCVPSYLLLEPHETAEELSAPCIIGAILCATVWAAALARGAAAIIRSRRILKRANGPLMAIAGTIRPRLVISSSVRDALSPEQLDVAVRHELAHGRASDNLKRFLLAFSPDLLPGVRGFTTLERNWERLAEWAADDDAVAGDSDRALTLASALVCVARLNIRPIPLASSLLDGDALSERVDRLLHPSEFAVKEIGSWIPLLSTTLALAASLIALSLRPATLASAHTLLERLIR